MNTKSNSRRKINKFVILALLLVLLTLSGQPSHNVFAQQPNNGAKGGDINGDGTIDIFDLALIASRYDANAPEADINGDGTVNIFDLVITAGNYNQSETVSTPPLPSAPDNPPEFEFEVVAQRATTPELILNELASNWIITKDFIYLHDPCISINDYNDFPSHGRLHLASRSGGTIITLADLLVDPDNNKKCLSNISSIAADNSAVYYDFVTSGGVRRIEKRPTTTPSVATPLYDLNKEVGSRLILDESDIYWISEDRNIYRAAKDGSKLEIIGNTGSNPTGIAVGMFRIYWLDDDGLWVQPKECSAPPCTNERQRLVKAKGRFLQKTLGGVIWIETSGSRESIRSFIHTKGATTLYTVPNTDEPRTRWTIGRPVVYNKRLFWQEFINGNSIWWDGRLRRMSLSSPDSAETIAEDLDASFFGLFVDDSGIYFDSYLDFSGDFPKLVGIVRLPLDTNPIVHDLEAAAIEVTQGIQNLSNDVRPLIADKTTYVRFYGRELTGTPARTIEAHLRGFDNQGRPLPGSPLRPVKYGPRELTRDYGH